MSKKSSRAAANNRANQMNPNNRAYWSSRGSSTAGTPNGTPATTDAKHSTPSKSESEKR